MTVPAALTPAMQSVIHRMVRAGHPPLHTLPPHEAKAAYAKGCDVLEVPRAPLARVQDLQVSARWRPPACTAVRAIPRGTTGADVYARWWFYHWQCANP
jgi:hypothetical protein